MHSFFNPLMLSRWQFAITTLFHMLWPLLSIGLGVFLVVSEAAWLKTGNELYYRHTRYWGKLFLLAFGVGVASGVPLEFQFGTNWARFSHASGDFFGNILGYEGAMAFMLEAAFLGIMVFAWNRVSRKVHMLATVFVAFGASLSAFWIMDANAWMQAPAGIKMVHGKAVITNYVAAVFNPAWAYSFTHMWVAAVETSLFFVAGVSAWCILRKRHTEFFLKSFKAAVVLAIVVTPLQIYLGDLSARRVAQLQPAKTAAMEAHWNTNPPGQGASWSLIAWPDKAHQKNAWQVNIPGVLSLLTTHSLTGQVKGLKAFPRNDQPPIVLPFYCFRIMVGIGFAMFALMLWALWQWRRGKLSLDQAGRSRWFWRAWVWAIPLGFIATDLGWIVREVGRQPWVLYGILRTRNGVSHLGTVAPAVTLFLYAGIYLGLLIFFIVFARGIVLKGPDLQSPLPAPQTPPGRRPGTPPASGPNKGEL